MITTSVMHYTGGKDRADGPTGFANFFKHLLFEGTMHMNKGKWMEMVEGKKTYVIKVAENTYSFYDEQTGLKIKEQEPLPWEVTPFNQPRSRETTVS